MAGDEDKEKIEKWQFAVIRLTQRGLDFIDLPSLNDPTCLGFAHRETFSAGGNDFWLSVVPRVVHEGVTTVDTIRTGRIAIARGVGEQISDFQNDQFANLVRPNGQGFKLPDVKIDGTTYGNFDATVIADRNATCNIKDDPTFASFARGNSLPIGMEAQMNFMMLRMKDLPPLPPEAVEQLSTAYAEVQLELIAGLAARYGLSEKALVEQAAAYGVSEDRLAEIRVQAAANSATPSRQDKPVAEPLAGKDKAPEVS